MASSGLYFFATAAGYILGAFIPDREVGSTIHGAKGAGKSTLYSSIREGFIPIYEPRKETTTIQSPNIIKVHLAEAPRGFRDYRNTDWIIRDGPHDPKYIPPQIYFVWPELIWWVLSADPTDEHYWKHPSNWEVISAIQGTLASQKYREATRSRLTLSTPMLRRRGVRKRQVIKKRRRARYVLMCINKIDLWEELPIQERVRKIREVRDYYFNQENGDGPLTWLRRHDTAGQLLVLGTSFKEGYCIRSNDAVQQPLSDYFTYLVRQIVTKKG